MVEKTWGRDVFSLEWKTGVIDGDRGGDDSVDPICVGLWKGEKPECGWGSRKEGVYSKGGVPYVKLHKYQMISTKDQILHSLEMFNVYIKFQHKPSIALEIHQRPALPFCSRKKETNWRVSLLLPVTLCCFDYYQKILKYCKILFWKLTSLMTWSAVI